MQIHIITVFGDRDQSSNTLEFNEPPSEATFLATTFSTIPGDKLQHLRELLAVLEHKDNGLAWMSDNRLQYNFGTNDDTSSNEDFNSTKTVPETMFPPGDDVVEWIPLRSLVGSETGARKQFESASVILAYDIFSQEDTVVYGQAAIEQILDSTELSQEDIVTVGIAPNTDDLETLCALVEAVKGYHECKSGEPA